MIKISLKPCISKILFIILILNVSIAFNIFLNSNVFAATSFSIQEATKSMTQNSSNESTITYEMESQEEIADSNTIKMLEKTLDKLKENVNSINEKIIYLKSSNEYETYPAVKLNVDTPIFGLSDIIASKMLITTDVSGSDISNKYSIYDVVLTRKIKVPVSYPYTSSIIKQTSDLEISNTMSKKQANIYLYKLLSYIEQTKDVEKFLDEKDIEIIKEFVSSDFKKKISDLELKYNNTIKVNNSNINNLNYLKNIGLSNINSYYDIQKEIEDLNFKIKNELNNIYLNYEEIDKLDEYIDDFYVKVYNFSYFIDMTVSENSSYDLLKVTNNLKNDMILRYNFIINYIEFSDEEKIFLNESDIFYGNNIFNINDIENKTKVENSEEETEKIYYYDENKINTENIDYDNLYEKLKNRYNSSNILNKKYDIYSKNLISNMQDNINAIYVYEQQVLLNIKKQNEIQIYSESEINTVDQSNKNIFNEISKIYLDYLKKENIFISDNIDQLKTNPSIKCDLIIKNCKYDITDIINNTATLNNNFNSNLESLDNNSILNLEEKNNELKKMLYDYIRYNIIIDNMYNFYNE